MAISEELLNSPLIKIGYIDEIEGYITGLTIAQANNYERLNPGTIFIFVDGDGKVRYLDITQVNQLTFADIERSDPCITTPLPCTSPVINFYGGGGIGAEGNAIVDQNGVIIAVDIVNRGFGYTTPPQVQIIDPCDNGSGAVIDTTIDGGQVDQVIVIDGGTGYLPPPETVPQYPAILELADVVVQNPGINYDCSRDELTVCIDRNGTIVKEPNGTIMTYECDPFGRITNVRVAQRGVFSEYVRICIHSKTGVNAELIPIFEVVRDPILAQEQRDLRKVIQVYDLIGLTVQGYVDGKPYYGKVYYDNEVKYAGVPGTGRPVRVYDTKTQSVNRTANANQGDSVRIVGAVEGTTQTTTTPTTTQNNQTTLVDIQISNTGQVTQTVVNPNNQGTTGGY